MTAEIQLNQSAHGLKRECLSYGEIIAQSIAVIAPTTTPAANIPLIIPFYGNRTSLSFLVGMIGLMFVAMSKLVFSLLAVALIPDFCCRYCWHWQ
jgi:hypothetical protein